MGEKKIENNSIPSNVSDIAMLTSSHKQELEVILIYPKTLGLATVQPYSHYILQYGLNKLGIANTLCEEGSSEFIRAFMENRGRYKIAARGAYYESISSVTKRVQRMKLFPEISKNIFTAVGGQAAINEDARKYMLTHGVDAICRGHAEPFFRFVEKLKELPVLNKQTSLDAAKDLLATLDQPKVPQGKFPNLDQFPLMANYSENETGERQINHVVIPHYGDCKNKCDFCSIIKMPPNNVEQAIVQTLKTANKYIPEMVFTGPNFEGELLTSFRRILSTTKEIQGNTPKTNQIMDSKQFQKKNYEEMLKLLKEFNVKKIHLGLNVIDGTTSRAVGRRDNGRIRTDEEIQEEKEGILKFLSEEEIDTFKIDMLLTPFDTPTSIEKLISFYREVLIIAERKNINASMRFYPLIPYPDTQLHRRYKDNIEIKSYNQLAGLTVKDLSMRKFDEEKFGMTYMQHYIPTRIESFLHGNQDPREQHYFEFLALNMVHQYLQGKKKLEDMELGFPEYKHNPVVIAMFQTLKKTAKENKKT